MTESMKDPKQPAKQPSRPEALRVRRVQFVEPFDIPGTSMGMPKSLIAAAEEQTNRTRHEIEFQPWLRHLRIAHYEPGKSEPSNVRMVHESRVAAWEPW
jgi:hypothetical protein